MEGYQQWPILMAYFVQMCSPRTASAAAVWPATVQMQSTPTNVSTERREDQTDIEFLDKFDESSVSKATTETKSSFRSLVEAPILSDVLQPPVVSADNVASKYLECEKENSAPICCSARRNIFAPEVPTMSVIRSPTRLSCRPIDLKRFKVSIPERGPGECTHCTEQVPVAAEQCSGEATVKYVILCFSFKIKRLTNRFNLSRVQLYSVFLTGFVPCQNANGTQAFDRKKHRQSLKESVC